MTYTTYKNTLILLLTLTLFSCSREGFLDFEPKGVLVPKTLSDFRLLLDQVEEAGLTNGLVQTHLFNVYVNDDVSLTRDIVLGLGLSNDVVARYTFQENFYLATQDDPEWANYYSQIYTANIVIDGLSTITAGDETEKNRLLAEAKLHRAFAYFNLVNLYSVHYDPNTAATDLGVPLREGIALEGVDLTRASVQAVYDYIIDDITTSIDALPDSNDNTLRHRPSKAGAYGLLAKVYLFQGQYQAALTQVDNALDIYNALRDMNTILDTDDSVFGGLLLPLAIEDEEIIWFKGASQPRFSYSPVIDNALIPELFETNDVRIQGFASLEPFITDESVADRELYSYYAYVFGRQFPAGINTPDMLLIKAECEARLGNSAAANTALNTLREKRFETGTYTPINITEQNALLDFVKEERRRELLWMPYRSFDIKRYNRFDNANITLQRNYAGATYTLRPNSLNWAFPIAQKYILQNPEIVQNPRD